MLPSLATQTKSIAVFLGKEYPEDAVNAIAAKYTSLLENGIRYGLQRRRRIIALYILLFLGAIAGVILFAIQYIDDLEQSTFMLMGLGILCIPALPSLHPQWRWLSKQQCDEAIAELRDMTKKTIATKTASLLFDHVVLKSKTAEPSLRTAYRSADALFCVGRTGCLYTVYEDDFVLFIHISHVRFAASTAHHASRHPSAAQAMGAIAASGLAGGLLLGAGGAATAAIAASEGVRLLSTERTIYVVEIHTRYPELPIVRVDCGDDRTTADTIASKIQLLVGQ